MTRAIWILMLIALPLRAAMPLYPLKASANGRYLLDAAGNPFFLINSGHGQNIIEKLSLANAAILLDSMKTNGFNSTWMFCLAGSSQSANGGGGLLDGTKSFNGGSDPGSYDLSLPNEAYWTNVDTVIKMAATNGINCLLHTMDVPSWLAGMKSNGSNVCYGFGQFLGNRYKNYTNIIWVHGMDYNTYDTGADDIVVIAVAKGIKSVDTNHIHTGDFSDLVLSHMDTLNAKTWWGIIGLNWIYTYDPTYAQANTSYSRTNLIPAFFGEGVYEYETQNSHFGSRNYVRRQNYWGVLGGGTAGFTYGGKSWSIPTGWSDATNLHSPGIIDCAYVTNIFVSRHWYELVPDQNHLLVSSGYGTYSTNADPTINTYAQAALTPDGQLGMVYTPTNNTLTVQLTNFSGSVTSRWYDVSAGTFTAITGSPFNNTGSTNLATPGNNAAGEGDWVLLLESAPPTSPTLFTGWWGYNRVVTNSP